MRCAEPLPFALALAAFVACQASGVSTSHAGGTSCRDQPIDAKKLLLKRTRSGKEKLVFVSKDGGFPFPAIGGRDDPSGSAGGAFIELFSPSEGTASLPVPAGIGKPGWTVKAGAVPLYRFVNRLAPGGISRVKTITLKAGKLIKVVAPEAGLPLATSHGSLGVRITTGACRSCARFSGSSIKKDLAGLFLGTNAPASALADCSDASLLQTGTTTTTTLPPGAGCGGEDTFQVIQDRIFSGHGCAVATCHGPFTQANLDLRPGAAYPELVGVLADNPTASAAGKLLVAPGDAAGSFLSQKLRGQLLLGEGSQMPLVGGVLSDTELDLVDAWIAAGAPQVGEVANAPCLEEEVYAPSEPLAVPPGGFQIVLEGPWLQPGTEQEGCMWIPAPVAADFDIERWEFSLNPGTHHFAIFEYNRAGAPVTNVWRANDFGCFSGAQFGNNITGAPQAPYYVDAYPSGVARRVRAGSYLGLNAHYFNEFDVPIQIKVWINAYPYPGTPTNIAQTIIAIDDTFDISIPPFTIQTHPSPGKPRARWTNSGATPRSIISLGGHMHQNGVRFTIWSSGGTKLYESFDWGHPNTRLFSPPLSLAPGDYFEYECLYDNGVNRPLRLDASGNPTNLIFGVSAEDAMCILTGQYY